MKRVSKERKLKLAKEKRWRAKIYISTKKVKKTEGWSKQVSGMTQQGNGKGGMSFALPALAAATFVIASEAWRSIS